jgi:hypothetical protein
LSGAGEGGGAGGYSSSRSKGSIGPLDAVPFALERAIVAGRGQVELVAIEQADGHDLQPLKVFRHHGERWVMRTVIAVGQGGRWPE